MTNNSDTPKEQPNNPLHGVKLADILDFLVAKYGWEKLGYMIISNVLMKIHR
jgi:uncharacterized protein (DUF2132 family)